MQSVAWRTYEEVAQHLLNEFANQFGLERVEKKQKLVGLRSGRIIEIDGKAVKEGDSGFLIVECKGFRGKKHKKVEAEKLEALAFRITDAGAQGGIVVTPIGLQAGAKKIAESENIVEVHLNKDSTTVEYVLQFLNRVMVGLKGGLSAHGDLQTFLIQKSDKGPATPR